MALVASGLSLVGTVHARDETPGWLTALSAAPVTVPAIDAPAVILLDEAMVEVRPDGTFITRQRWAVRVLTPEGRRYAVGVVGYNSSSETVKTLQAWMLPPAGAPIALGKKRISDVPVYANALELYGEARRQTISAPDDALPGAVFGFESLVEERSIFPHRLWDFQAPIPVQRSRVTLSLPEGWDVAARLFNHAALAPTVAGRARTWELTDLAPLTPEPLAPGLPALAPSLALEVIPPAGGPKIARRRAPATWEEMAKVYTPFYDEAAAWDAAMKTRADALTAGAPDLRSRVRALCRFAQEVNYISIQLDTGNAGGLIPRPAARVLRCHYGDCKDKSTLLRALLASQGIAAFPVIVYYGEPHHVRTEWPSPSQFNHCILAITVDASVDDPAVQAHPTLGRLLFFDPTAEFTAMGLLPVPLYGSRGLVLAGERGGLVTLPAARPGLDRLQRKVTARVDDAGNVVGSIEEIFIGNAADTARANHARQTPTNYQKQVERSLAVTLPAPRAKSIVVVAAADDSRWTRAYDFAASAYGKPLRDVLLVFKPALLARRDHVLLRPGKPRRLPLVLTATSFSEEIEITLPPGYAVDEMLPAIDLRTPFGTFRSSATLVDGRLRYERAVEFPGVTLPASDYDLVRSFFEKMQQAEQTPVVLKRL